MSASAATALQARGAPVSTAPGPGIAVAIRQVGKVFGPTTVLRDLSLEIPAGQFLAIVGRSGSGKSTLLRLICGLDAPSQGRILFDGAAAEPAQARLMFQEPRLLPWAKVIDNVAVGLRPGGTKAERQSQAAEALRAVGLGNRGEEWPGVLSGGQKQRVALARALVSRPGLLLLDEPLGALDALTRLEMQGLVAQSWRQQGFTAVLVTHDVSEAVRLADRIIVLQDGVVTLDVGNPWAHPRREPTAEAVALEQRLIATLMGQAPSF